MRIVILLPCCLMGIMTACNRKVESSGSPVVRSDTPTSAPAGEQPELNSLLGRPLYARPPGGNHAERESALIRVLSEAAAAPDDLPKSVWPGRHLGYLWRMHEAIDYYTKQIAEHPEYAPFYRHRGHRYISIRQFDKAITDLERAAELIRDMPDEIEPDGMPNARNIPLTTTAFNVWYHLGLARYCKGDFEGALRAYRETMKFSQRHDDNLVATTYWMYMTLRRLGREKAAAALLEPIRPDMTIIENEAYHECLLMYKGFLKPEVVLDPEAPGDMAFVTLGYGVGNWYFFNGEREKAEEIFRRVVATEHWPAFGFIAAEVDLARM